MNRTHAQCINEMRDDGKKRLSHKSFLDKINNKGRKENICNYVRHLRTYLVCLCLEHQKESFRIK